MENTVHILCWSGAPEVAEREVRMRFTNCNINFLNQREFREQGSKGQISVLRGLRGRAFVVFFSSSSDNRMPQVLALSGLVHRCSETILAVETGEWRRYRCQDWFKMFPTAFWSAVCDSFTYVFTRIFLKLIHHKPQPIVHDARFHDDLAYLLPFPFDQTQVGGSVTHIRGFLKGFWQIGGKCHLYSGRPFALDEIPATLVTRRRRSYLFHELATLSFNFWFARRIGKILRKRRPRAIYQRHGRFAIAGALVSRWLRVPLVLEFNGFESWVARHWDPSRFSRLLTVCEEFNLASASLIVVVSEVLRDDLILRGLPVERIIVNPNGVNTDHFLPSCGGKQVRNRLDLQEGDVVAGFIGTFSYWHGVEVLQSVILKALDVAKGDAVLRHLKFLLIGEGPLFAEMKKRISEHRNGRSMVIFTGSVPHDQVPSYLDATDILLSPHIPMPDGRRFFGSPTKLFEYMAMGKSIIASRLDQLAVVLEHNDSALLVAPGDSDDLFSAIKQLAADPELRVRLGRRARTEAGAKYTWKGNAKRVLERLRTSTPIEDKNPDLKFSPIAARCNQAADHKV